MDNILKQSKKLTSIILKESLLVGVLLVIIYSIIDFILPESDYKIHINLLLSGILFHIGFEYTGLNEWYSLDYCKLIAKN